MNLPPQSLPAQAGSWVLNPIANNMERFSGVAGCETETRLDRYLADHLKLFSRSCIKNSLIEIRVNGKPAKLSKKITAGDSFELIRQETAETKLEAQPIPLDILYEDKQVVVVNKPAGMVVHPGAGNPRGTLANALLYRRMGTPEPGPRSGIVHRLDRDTSGVIIAARDEQTLAFLAAQFKARTVKKRYAAIVHGTPPDRGAINAAIIRDPKNRKRFAAAVSGGKPAQTRYTLVRSWGAYSLLLVRPRTGRTHQIRVHLKSIGHPVAGDPLYGGDYPADNMGLMLHSYSLEIILPGHTEASLFRAPIPSRFRVFMDRADGRTG